MAQKIKTYAWDITEHLRTQEEMATYLNVVLEEGDPDLFVSAIGDIAKARGMAEIAEKTGVSRESLSRSFRKGSDPKLTTLVSVMKTLGMKLTAEPCVKA